MLSKHKTKTSFQSSWKDTGEGIWQLFQPSDFAGQGTGGGSRAWNVLLRKQYLSLTRDEVGGWLRNSQPIYACTESLKEEKRRRKDGIKFLYRSVICLCPVEACLYVSAPVGWDDHWPLGGVRCGLPQRHAPQSPCSLRYGWKTFFRERCSGFLTIGQRTDLVGLSLFICPAWGR